MSQTADEPKIAAADSSRKKPEPSGIEVQRELNHKRTVILCTLHKSGTHWTRYLFANYMQLLAGVSDVPISYKRMQRRVGNNRVYINRGRKSWSKPARFVRQAGLRDFVWQHFEDDLDTARGPIILQYRNPLDALISRFHYDCDRWKAAGRNVNHPRECLFAVEEFAAKYARMRAVSKKRTNAIMVSYERLKQAPEAVFETMVSFAGLPIMTKLIERAVLFSSAENVRQEEIERGRAIVSPTTTGYFVRDGSIGQWRSVLNAEDLSDIESILSRHGVSLEEFQV